ncbi:MAG TPA: transglutaminase-like cysteine peptidase [Aestuariivirga sp.]|nr:transglutaminase-like cysteine peptidase [Aestuariivirga sp.]
MQFRSSVISGAIACLFSVNSALAFGPGPKDAAPEFGRTLPPVGFVKFCVTNPADCKTRNAAHRRIAMTPERWNQLYVVNSYVNGKVAPISDQDLYGEAEHWAYPTDAGDCEDYVLLKKRQLEGLGFSPEALLITVVLDEKNEGHAILTVTTDAGDYVLDNRFDKVSRWNDTKYKFLKRQSHANPLQWVALMKQSTSTSGFVASGN